MKQWRIEYAYTPTNYTERQSLMVEAESRDDALITAIMTLDRQGTTLSFGYGGFAPEGLTAEGGVKLAQFERGGWFKKAVIQTVSALDTNVLPGRVI
jgi:hypothetical protein